MEIGPLVMIYTTPALLPHWDSLLVYDTSTVGVSTDIVDMSLMLVWLRNAVTLAFHYRGLHSRQ
jgi:hypothetical protein